MAYESGIVFPDYKSLYLAPSDYKSDGTGGTITKKVPTKKPGGRAVAGEELEGCVLGPARARRRAFYHKLSKSKKQT